MNSNMIRTLTVGACLACACLSPTLAPQAIAQSAQAQATTIHPRYVNELLKVAAAHWDISLGKARQAYSAGEMTFQVLEVKPGAIDVMIFYASDCITSTVLTEMD
jgi:hypothetical protein